MQPWKSISTLLLCAITVAMWGADQQPTGPPEVLLSQIVSLAAWERFWYGENGGIPKIPGGLDHVYFWSSPDMLFICSEGLHFAGIFDFTKAGQLREIDSRRIPSKESFRDGCMNSQREMLDMTLSLTPVVPKVSGNEDFSPAQMPRPTPRPFPRSRELTLAFEIRWPVIADYQALSASSPGLDSLIKEIRLRLEPPQKCAESAIIPRYTSTDPSVFVLLRESDCTEAILAFERNDRGRWFSSAKLTADAEVIRYKPKIVQRATATVRTR